MYIYNTNIYIYIYDTNNSPDSRLQAVVINIDSSDNT